jgi:hypothetical protein
MSRIEEVFTIFLASPSDVGDERQRFVEVIGEWNKAWSRELGLRLDVQRWEDNAYPAIGEDAQDVINGQIPDDYDLFVGIMWSRFGTPTTRAGSGTEEEFLRALARYRGKNEKLDILFYFRDAPISPSKLDPVQLTKVQAFKASLQVEGLLFWEFSDVEQFEKYVNLHLTRHVQAWRARQVQVSSEPSAQILPVSVDSAIDDDDAGYIDLLEEFAIRSSEMADIATRLSAAQNELTEHTQKGAAELDAIRSLGKEVSPGVMRRSIARVADEMLRFTNRIEAEIPLFREAADQSMTTLVRVATLAAELDIDQIAGTKVAANTLLSTLVVAQGATVEFKRSTVDLPRMTKELNIAKRKQVVALDRLIAEFDNTVRLLIEAIAIINALPEQGAESIIKCNTQPVRYRDGQALRTTHG